MVEDSRMSFDEAQSEGRLIQDTGKMWGFLEERPNMPDAQFFQEASDTLDEIRKKDPKLYTELIKYHDSKYDLMKTLPSIEDSEWVFGNEQLGEFVTEKETNFQKLGEAITSIVSDERLENIDKTELVIAIVQFAMYAKKFSQWHGEHGDDQKVVPFFAAPVAFGTSEIEEKEDN